MKKILLSLLSVLISFSALAQTQGDKVTINLNNGKSEVWDLTDDGRTPLSAFKHTADGKLEAYMKGVDDTPLGEYNTADIKNITFTGDKINAEGNVVTTIEELKNRIEENYKINKDQEARLYKHEDYLNTLDVRNAETRLGMEENQHKIEENQARTAYQESRIKDLETMVQDMKAMLDLQRNRIDELENKLNEK